MPATIPAAIRSRLVRYILLKWSPADIAAEVHCALSTVYQIRDNMFFYDSPFRPTFRPMGACRKITVAAGDSLKKYLEEQPWAYQKEMVWFLWEEWGIFVHQSTISRFIKKIQWSNKKGQRIGHRRDDDLRLHWIADLLHVTAEQMVCVDETLFNEMTGWRHRAYAPIGQPARYHADRKRGVSWSVLPAYTIWGYLPCTGIKEGWFKSDDFYEWLRFDLLPLCGVYPAHKSVIIMDNASTHCNARIKELIEAHGCQVKYLPPYSPDYNPIELSFSVLKAWVRAHFHEMWPRFEGTFGEFLKHAVEQSRCDRFAVKHFKYSANGYIFEGELEAFNERLDAGLVNFETLEC